MPKDWCASCQNNSKDYDDIVCVMCVWQEEDNDNLPPTNYIYKPQTNADRIRAMTDEEIAGLIAEHPCPPNTPLRADCYIDCQVIEAMPKGCKKCWLDWLKQEATT